MKPPPSDDVEACDSGPLGELYSAVRSGDLVGVLRGEGLTRGTIDQLLRPENAPGLRSILTDHLSSAKREPCPGGKVLTFRRKKTPCTR